MNRRPDWFPAGGLTAAELTAGGGVAHKLRPSPSIVGARIVDAGVADESGRGFPPELLPIVGPAIRNLERADARTLLRRARRHGSVFITGRLELAAARRLEGLGLGAVELINGGPCRRFTLAEATG